MRQRITFDFEDLEIYLKHSHPWRKRKDKVCKLNKISSIRYLNMFYREGSIERVAWNRFGNSKERRPIKRIRGQWNDKS